MPISPRRVELPSVPEKPVSFAQAKQTQPQNEHHCHECKHDDKFGKKILMTIFGVLMVYIIFYVGSLMRNAVKQYYFIGQADQQERMITITGYAKATAKNDIALTTIGFTNLDGDVAKAQADNAKVMNAVINDLKQLGVDEKDMTSDYSMNPDYDYTSKGQVFKGYRVTNNITVKVRDLTKVSSVLALPAKDGANQVGSLTFTIDDTENLKSMARAKALEDAKRKAAALAKSLGVVLGEIVSYNDYELSSPVAYGRGGMMMDAVASAPAVVSGTNDVGMNVNVTYKIYPAGY